MSFEKTYLLAAACIASVGLLFFAIGFGDLRRRRFGLTTGRLLREAWLEMTGNRQESGRGRGFYFIVFGLVLVLICSGATGTMLFLRAITPAAAGPVEEDGKGAPP